MYVIRLASVESLIKELAEATSGAVLGGVVWCQEDCDWQNEAKCLVSSIWTAILRYGAMDVLVECQMTHGLDIVNAQKTGSDGLAEARHQIEEAAADLGIRCKEGRVELL